MSEKGELVAAMASWLHDYRFTPERAAEMAKEFETIHRFLAERRDAITLDDDPSAFRVVQKRARKARRGR
jgi:hypothetical protein